jgi:hypothetical protein
VSVGTVAVIEVGEFTTTLDADGPVPPELHVSIGRKYTDGVAEPVQKPIPVTVIVEVPLAVAVSTIGVGPP